MVRTKAKKEKRPTQFFLKTAVSSIHIFSFYGVTKYAFFRGLEIRGNTFSPRYELSRDYRESILGVVVRNSSSWCSLESTHFYFSLIFIYFFQIQLLLQEYFFGASSAPLQIGTICAQNSWVFYTMWDLRFCA